MAESADIVVREHKGGMWDPRDPIPEFHVSSLNDVLALPWIKDCERGDFYLKGRDLWRRRFVGWRRSGDCLLALYGECEESWHVVAHVKPSSALEPLELWRISPVGQAIVDAWNRGDMKANRELQGDGELVARPEDMNA